ncbi:flagellar hook-basal body complex protein FliE [Janthinobacterium sp. 64]|uniref:flagellar hook-basal body complex protein FliE n=1 Tax=Janthinobacterium sp. 64 TaxID=2035208 RepID=UPI000C2C1D05|nr:flagellar hook-basal body complex protein FliE [Janthinobacterium sp. 64]PKB13898.1 flagellar hook-basal body complex protein FliE [Janthinobacterium sp. 64]
MVIESIAAAALAQPGVAPVSVQPPAVGFGQWFAAELKSVNTSLGLADTDVKKLAAGETQSLHEVMIHLEEAKLSFQLLAQVRNRLLDAYQEVMRMQV